MSTLKVAYVTHYEPIHDFRFLESLSRISSLEVVVILYLPKIPEEWSRLSNVRVHLLHHPLFPFDDPWRIEYPFRTRLRLRLAQFYYARKLRNILKNESIDLLHAGWVQSDGMVAALTGFHPFLLMPYGSDILINPDRNQITWKKTAWILRKSDHIMCDCQTVVEKIRKIEPLLTENQFLVFPWGVDLSVFYPRREGLSTRPLRMIMTRSLYPVYNISFFLDLVVKIRNEISNVEVILVGDGPEHDKLMRKTKELGIESVVRFVGAVEHDKISDLFRSSSLYVSTSLSDGTSISLLEAMACGLPCAVSDIPSNREWVDENKNGILLDLNHVEESAKKITDLLRDLDQMKKWGLVSRQIAENRADWKKNIEKMVDLYRTLVNGNPR